MTDDHAEQDAQLAELEALARWNDVAKALDRYAQRSTGPRRVALLLRVMRPGRLKGIRRRFALLATNAVFSVRSA